MSEGRGPTAVATQAFAPRITDALYSRCHEEHDRSERAFLEELQGIARTGVLSSINFRVQVFFLFQLITLSLKLRRLACFPTCSLTDMRSAIPLASALFAAAPSYAAYNLIKEYQGSNFFSGWEFYGNYDNLTNGAHTKPSRTL